MHVCSWLLPWAMRNFYGSTRSLLLAVLVIGPLGCGSDEEVSPQFPELDALDTTPDPSCSGTWVAGVTGRIVDENGAGVPAAFPQMCVRLAENGFLSCLVPEPARDDGYFGQVIPADNRCMSDLNFRVFLGDSPYGTTYCRSDLRAEDGILSIGAPLVLYEVTPAADLPPEGDPEVSRTVVLADGLELDVIPAPLYGSYAELGASRLDESTCFADESFDVLYALTPESLTFRFGTSEVGFPVRIPTSLPEGSVVDLYVLGGLDEFELATGTTLTEGAFEKFGTGHVADGMIVSDSGSELPYLTWLGVRAQ